ncbi:hypothetical protein B0T22DRAFT_310218 [Podospora appendiculata]|uniref:NmrA-like domain-containing protein n=1 Tax=Podospora appendiculata TaxID=314037 RepID=A0AAE1C759_9PEZI|nr:hypothetical protein B0T22DRAFT_310218 [Podospora appendiculata]
METNQRTILIAGATGKQGRSLIHALLGVGTESAAAAPSLPDSTTESPDPPPQSQFGKSDDKIEWNILALTRSASSPRSRALLLPTATRHKISLVEGDLADRARIRAIFADAAGAGEPIWGVYVVLAYPGLGSRSDVEKEQGKMLADLALEFRVQAFVYSSAIPVGPRPDDSHDYSHQTKRELEKYCQELGERGLNWIILRPGFFMENFDGFLGSIAVTLLREGLRKETTISVISSEDIGKVAAGVFANHEKYIRKILCLTSGSVTIREVIASHQRATGKPMPAVPAFLGKLLLRINRASQDIVKEMNRSHEVRTNGEYPTFDSEVQLAKSVHAMQTYEEWKRSMATAKAQPAAETMDGGWNNVSVFKLFTGRS